MGFENKGIFFVINVPVVIVTRFVAGKYVDKVGAKRNIFVGLLIVFIACYITGTAPGQSQFLVSSLIFGLGTAIITPAIMAWTADLANPAYKGRGMATMFIALELGFLNGNYIAQQVYQNKEENIFESFVTASILVGISVLYLIFFGRKGRSSFN